MLFLFVTLLLISNHNVVASVILELLLKSLELEIPNGGSQNLPSWNASFLLQISDGLHSINWTWTISNDLSDDTKLSIVFPEFLTSTIRNPLYLLTNSPKRSGIRMKLSVISQNQPIAEHCTALAPHWPIALGRNDATWQHVTLVNGTSRLHLLTRFYCDKESYGNSCEYRCTTEACPSAIRGTEATTWSNLVTQSTDLSDPTCPEDPCILLNIPTKGYLNEVTFKAGLDLLLTTYLRQGEQRMEPPTGTSNPGELHTELHVNDIDLADGGHVVSVSAKATLSGYPIHPIVVKQALHELASSQWLSQCFKEYVQTPLVASLFNSHMENSATGWMNQPATPRNKSRTWLIVGFWIVLAMSVTLSVLVIFLVGKRRKRNVLDPTAVQRLISDDHSLGRTTEQRAV